MNDASVAWSRLRIGIDIAVVSDFESLVDRDDVLCKQFSHGEIAECRARHEDAGAALARRFAAKEALIKATSQRTSELWQIEILHRPDGAPYASWEYLKSHRLACQLSLSSAGPFAIAVAIVGPCDIEPGQRDDVP